jgi:chaperonin GroEL
MASDRTRMETVVEDPHILMTSKPISHAQDLLPALDQVMKAPRPLVILAEKIDGSALGMLVANNQHQTLQAVAVRAPGFGHRRVHHLGDLAASTGGQVIADEAGLTLAHVKAESFGSARRVIVTADSATFIEGAGTREVWRRGCTKSGPSSAGRRRSATSRCCRSASRAWRCRWP